MRTLEGIVGEIMAKELGWASDRLREQIKSYEKEVRHRYLAT